MVKKHSYRGRGDILIFVACMRTDLFLKFKGASQIGTQCTSAAILIFFCRPISHLGPLTLENAVAMACAYMKHS